MYLSEQDYLTYLKAKATRRALQEAELIQARSGTETAEQIAIPPFMLGLLTLAPVWTADDLRKFEALADGGEWAE